MIAQQIGFTITSVLGIWTWLIHPALRRAEAEIEMERIAVNLLDDDDGKDAL